MNIINLDLSTKQMRNAVVGLAIKHRFYAEVVMKAMTPHPSDKFAFNFRILIVEGKVVGFTTMDWRKDNKDGKCMFEFLLVDEAERGKGYGKLLIEDVINWCKEVDKCYIKVQFETRDEKLKIIYGKYDFKHYPEEEPKDYQQGLMVGITNWYKIIS